MKLWWIIIKVDRETKKPPLSNVHTYIYLYIGVEILSLKWMKGGRKKKWEKKIYSCENEMMTDWFVNENLFFVKKNKV